MKTFLAFNDCDPKNIPARVFATLDEAMNHRTDFGRPNRIVEQYGYREWTLAGCADQTARWCQTKGE